MTEERPYGAWTSPIVASLISAQKVRLSDIALDGENVYWCESRPHEGGRYTVVRRSAEGMLTELVPTPYNVRTRVHEYGGLAYAVVDGAIVFTNFADQRVYRVVAGGDPEPLTPEGNMRHADFTLDRGRNRLLAVREDILEGAQEPRNTIAALPLDGTGLRESHILVAGYDFYAYPRISHDGSRLAWIAWSHPNMPWDGTELWVADIDEAGAIARPRRVAGGPSESIVQPEWSPDGTIHFISDQTGWWNLYRLDEEGPVNLTPEEAEYGVPLWKLGARTYAFAPDGTIVAASTWHGLWSLATIEPRSGARKPITLPSTAIDFVNAGRGTAVALLASPVEAAAIAKIDLRTHAVSVLRASSSIEMDRGYLSVPGAITFPTSDGQVAHAFYYPPQNREFHAPAGELPPLIVESHGGPTGSASAALDLSLQYWTSRGFAVLDVNYRGSTGYGRPYRDALRDKWGIYDVDDCVNGALYLAGEGLVDPDRLVIHGWSASGYTTLAALTFRNTFRAGASHYGISDLEAMTRDTHKFESRYLDGLIGPWPEASAIYDERSPIHFVDRLSCPLILFQGDEDKVVPPNQAVMMFDAVKAKGLPVALVMFAGEQHGFRKAENIERALEAELAFLGAVLGFSPADQITPVSIENG
jgi:dipeptidyl aminopeptidase/acylaminoacyl peptidase